MEATFKDWAAAIALCKKGGFFPSEAGGMNPEQVKWFSRGLRKAVEDSRVNDESTLRFLERLLVFLDGDGASGFRLERAWTDWRRAG
jgi:hypothetical protein